MDDLVDIRVDNDIVWAVAPGLLRGEKHQDLTHRALALASELGHAHVIFDYRGARLTHDVLVRHAGWLVKAEQGMTIRAALLVSYATPDSEFWARLLRPSGVTASVFTDAAVAVKWLQGHVKNDQPGSAVADHDAT
jgi:hypothetical protein